MNEILKLSDELEKKINSIINQKKSSDKSNQILMDENKVLKEKITQKETTINELIKKNKVLIISKSINSEESKRDTKVKINQLVREIDKCIALLNH